MTTSAKTAIWFRFRIGYIIFFLGYELGSTRIENCSFSRMELQKYKVKIEIASTSLPFNQKYFVYCV
jgi:hypothetical protein